MARTTPEMVMGLRNVESLDHTNAQEAFAKPPTRLKGERLFQSSKRQYRLQLTEGITGFRDPVTGRMTPTIPGKVAQFEDGYFRTADPEIAALIEASPRYGIGMYCWDADAVQEMAAEVYLEQVVEMAKSNPELAARLRKELPTIEGEDYPEEAKPTPVKGKAKHKPAPKAKVVAPPVEEEEEEDDVEVEVEEQDEEENDES